MKHLLWILPVMLLLGGCAWFYNNSRANTETPNYKVTQTDGAFELREYPDLKLAKTGMVSDADGSFMRLFGYISGKNEREEKIAMTTPVFIDRSTGAGSMSFIVPKAVEAKGAPKPKADAVKVEAWKGGKLAVHRFDGSARGKNEAEAVQKLRAWCSDQKLTTEGEPVFAYYDPPWTPSFLRRSEVMIRVQP
ncbi:MAG: SOUL family heme-binding protein [Verrucomicrobiaceae bacterium]